MLIIELIIKISIKMIYPNYANQPRDFNIANTRTISSTAAPIFRADGGDDSSLHNMYGFKQNEVSI